MTIDKALEHLKYDVRLIEYHMDNGVIQKADLEKHLTELPDSSDNVNTAVAEEQAVVEEDTEQQTL